MKVKECCYISAEKALDLVSTESAFGKEVKFESMEVFH